MKTFLLVNNVRSVYNVGSLFRLADAVALTKLYLTGFTPYPKIKNDTRPAYVTAKVYKELRKTGLEGIDAVSWEYQEDVLDLCQQLKSSDIKLVAIEQTATSRNYLEYLGSNEFLKLDEVCFIVGHEREGVDRAILDLCDTVIEIPMLGKGKSLNVAMSATVVLFSAKIFGK